MDWSQVYTHTQRDNLILTTLNAAKDFLNFVQSKNFVGEKDEVIIKQLSYALVVSGGKFAEKKESWMNLGDKDGWGFEYEPMQFLSDYLIEFSYRLAPQDFLNACEAVHKKIAEKSKAIVVPWDVLKDLKALCNSIQINDLISERFTSET